MGSHAGATVRAVGGEVRDRLEQPVLESPGWADEIAQQSSGMMQSLAHDVDEVGTAATAGNLAVGMAIAMTPMLPEAMAVVSSGGEDSGAIVGLMFAVLETVAMGAARRPRGRGGGGWGTASAFGGLSRAGQFGIQPYNHLTRALKGTGLQAHHLIEQRFADVLGQNARQMASVALTKAEHQAFTNAWRSAIPYGRQGTANATRQQVLDAARQIYSGHPELLRALGL